MIQISIGIYQFIKFLYSLDFVYISRETYNPCIVMMDRVSNDRYIKYIRYIEMVFYDGCICI